MADQMDSSLKFVHSEKRKVHPFFNTENKIIAILSKYHNLHLQYSIYKNLIYIHL